MEEIGWISWLISSLFDLSVSIEVNKVIWLNSLFVSSDTELTRCITWFCIQMDSCSTSRMKESYTCTCRMWPSWATEEATWIGSTGVPSRYNNVDLVKL